MSPHILFDITAHGLGHLAQTAPVIEAVVRRRPDALITIRSGLAADTLQRRIGVPFRRVSTDDDFGLVMKTSFIVDRTATADRYRALHARLDSVVGTLASEWRAERIDLVVSNVGYLALAAAARAGIANIAFSTINWHDVVHHYCGDRPGLRGVLREIANFYRGVDVFLRLEPGISMVGFSTVPVPELIVARGRSRRRELETRLGIKRGATVIAFSFTEVETQAPPTLSIPGNARIVCIGPRHWALGPPWVSFETTGFPFLDLLHSVNLVVAKPGYGIVTEAAIAGTPTLLVGRDDWPETAATSVWHTQHGRFETSAVPLHAIRLDEMLAAGARLATQPAGPEPNCGGADRIAEAIFERLPACGARG